MDQGNDAIHMREILVGHKLLLLGPETSIFGLYAGPLWYYFIAVGYFLSGGHPAGPVILLIILNSLLTLIIIRKLSIEVSPKVGLFVGMTLQASWWFYDASRYAFNPFPDTFLAFIALFCLTDFLKGDKKKYYWAAGLFGLFFHTDLASAVAVNIFFFGFGLWALAKHKIKFDQFILANVIIGLFLTPHLLSELIGGFSQTKILLRQLTDKSGVFHKSEFGIVSTQMMKVVARSIYRQIPEIGFLAAVIIITLFIRRAGNKKTNIFVRNFIILSLFVLLTSWIFFATNLGWRDWQTSFLSPLIFVALILAILEFHTFMFAPVLIISIFSHLQVFKMRYGEYLKSTPDPSILANEMKAIDWSYSQAHDKSFSVYIYIPSIFDYHYQYLYWWYGKNKYGYLPCEMNTFPGAPKTYMPDKYWLYEKPKGNCPSKTRVLIMEPDSNNAIDQTWYQDITEGTVKKNDTNIGRLKLETRELR